MSEKVVGFCAVPLQQHPVHLTSRETGSYPLGLCHSRISSQLNSNCSFGSKAFFGGTSKADKMAAVASKVCHLSMRQNGLHPLRSLCLIMLVLVVC